MEQCPNCGSSVREWKDTCDECGASLRGDQPGGWQSQGGGQGRHPPEQQNRRQEAGGQGRQNRQSRGGQQQGVPRGGGPPSRQQQGGQQGRGQRRDGGVDRRTLLASGGVAAAALAGGWFVFLREGGDADSGTAGDDAGPTTTPESVSPGESQSEAPTITSGRYGPFTLEEGDRQHYLAVDLDAGDQVAVTMEFSHDQGDLDISLLGPNALIGTASSITDDETLSTTANTSGEHYINTYVISGAPNNYELDVRIN